MRKVSLRMNETYKYEVIKTLVDTNGNKHRAAQKLGCTARTINRLIIKYKHNGKQAFVHGNRGRAPAIAMNQEVVETVLSLYNTKYDGSNIKHFTELLEAHEDIKVSPRTVLKWLAARDMLSPKARRKTRKNLKKKLKLQMSSATTTKEIRSLDNKIELIDRCDAHPRRPRCSYFGEMIQMDASEYIWFGDHKTHLHVAVDDATGMIVGASFDTQETLNGYYNTLYRILVNHGIPACFYTDKRTVFEYTKKASSTTEDTFTQFSYACNQLGIEIKTTSVPQAKGRVERLNQTLQSRLPIELKIAGVSSIKEANEFLESYIKVFNTKFSLPINSNKSVFEKQPTIPCINQTLARINHRIIDAGHSIKYKHHYYSIRSKMGQALFFPKGTKVLVIEAFDQSLFVTVDESVYALEIIDDYESYSKNFDEKTPDISPKERYIPSITHPWKIGSFNAHLLSMKHRDNT